MLYFPKLAESHNFLRVLSTSEQTFLKKVNISHFLQLRLLFYFVGLHFPPHFDFGYLKKNSTGSQTEHILYHVIPNILCGINFPKHKQVLITMCLKSHWISETKKKNFDGRMNNWYILGQVEFLFLSRSPHLKIP